MNFILGLDIGIGSVGWAVIRNDEKKRIEDFGVRIFDSGESDNGQERKSQERRGYRSSRRLVTRRSHRKNRLRAHLVNIGFVTEHEIRSFYETSDNNIIKLRVKGLDEKLTPAELTACLVHICNYRGFNNYYDIADSDNILSAEEKKELESEYKGAQTIAELMSKGYRSVAEMYEKDDAFANKGSDFRKYRNRNTSDIKLVDRKYLTDEYQKLMKKQREYYPVLNDNTINILNDIIFRQRDFEDGPGDPRDKTRRYMGFLDSIGKCRFYRNEIKANRSTAIADIFAVVNSISQCRLFDKNGSPIRTLPVELSGDILDWITVNGNMTFTELKKLCKNRSVEIDRGELKSDFLSRSFKFLPAVRKLIESSGMDWTDFNKDMLSEQSILNRIGNFLSTNVTPRRRAARIAVEFPELNDEMRRRLIGMRTAGTANVCAKYMTGIIGSFIESGTLAGETQRDEQEKAASELPAVKKHRKLPAFRSEDDNEFFKNPVVFRSINETRKVVNAIIDRYGSPSAINIEVASELNRSYEDRLEIDRLNRNNMKRHDSARKSLKELLPGVEPNETMILRYLLWEQQGHKCLYSGREIPPELLANKDHTLEIDHIVPFSLILDDTFNNKALVYHSENQFKGQQTPLMYLTGDKKAQFIATVKKLYHEKTVSKTKYDYLMQPDLDSEKMDGWKSRNINDTRYISKYLRNYFRDNLLFSDDREELYRERVYAVKSVLTSRFRREWLNRNTWGTYDKKELKEFTFLDHAVDAIVIANLVPAYAEIAQVQMKLAILFKRNRHITDEYRQIEENCVNTMKRFYHMNEKDVKGLLENKTEAVSPIIPRLNDEVDFRVCDIQSFRYFDSKSKTPQDLTDEQICELFRRRIDAFYADDPSFAAGISMPITSHKQSFRLQSSLSKDQALSIVNVDGTEYQKVRKPIGDITLKLADKIYSSDESLKSSLKKLLNGNEKITVKEALEKQELDRFVTDSGMEYSHVSLLAIPKSYFIKEIGTHDEAETKRNYTVLPHDGYYCFEVYRTKKGKTALTGIYPTDIEKENGRMYLSRNYTYPDDYSEHIEYLFKRDYIELYKKKKGGEECYFRGYFNSGKNINRNQIIIRDDNQSVVDGNKHNIVIVQSTSRVKRVSIDILGRRGGYIKCGEPLSYLPEKK